MKKSYLSAFAIIFTLNAFAQIEKGSFTATGKGGVSTTLAEDYQSIGINPANLGIMKKEVKQQFAVGLLESGISIYSDALKKSELKESVFQAGKQDSLSKAEKLAASKQFANSGISMDFDMNILGFSAQIEKVGGFAISIKEHLSGNIILNDSLSDILFNGYNANYFDYIDTIAGDSIGVKLYPQQISTVISGTKFNLIWYREYAFGYGRQIISNDNFELYGGVAFKYLQGFGLINIFTSEDKFIARGALSPIFNVDYGSALTDPGKGFKPVGSGFGIDIGVTARIKEKYSVGLALTDFGSISWKKNYIVAAGNDVLTNVANPGINSLNIFTEADEFLGKNGFFTWTYVKDGDKVKLPTNIRLGASAKLLENLTVGTDFVVSMNTDVPGSYEKPVMAVGGEYSPLPWLKISTGFNTGGNYRANIPFGITFSFNNGMYEFGVATRQLTTFIGQNNPNLSLSAGFLRFRF